MEVNRNLTKVETGFNIASGIPIVGMISGLLRMVAAKIQFVVGAVIGLVGLIGQMIHNGSKKMEDLAQTGLTHMMHGALNGARGFGEVLLGCTVIGSLGLLGGQLASKNKFAPIVKYDEPIAAQVVEPQALPPANEV